MAEELVFLDVWHTTYRPIDPKDVPFGSRTVVIPTCWQKVIGEKIRNGTELMQARHFMLRWDVLIKGREYTNCALYSEQHLTHYDEYGRRQDECRHSHNSWYFLLPGERLESVDKSKRRLTIDAYIRPNLEGHFKVVAENERKTKKAIRANSLRKQLHEAEKKLREAERLPQLIDDLQRQLNNLLSEE